MLLAAHHCKAGDVKFYEDAKHCSSDLSNQPTKTTPRFTGKRVNRSNNGEKNEHYTHLYLPLSSRFCAVNRRVILCLSDESTWKQSCVTIILKQQFSSRKDLITGLCKLKEVTRWHEKSATKAARERASRDIRVTSPPNHLPTN